LVNRAEILKTMFFQSKIHKVVKVNDATEAANKIKSGDVLDYHALNWQNENGDFYAVSDAHIDDSYFAETAVLMKENGLFFQLESITAAWIDSACKLAQYFKNAETDRQFKLKVDLIIDEATNQIAWFTCGCCGTGFKDSVKYQLDFDQGAGYGICKDCEKYYK
jgi:hypothetical protein